MKPEILNFANKMNDVMEKNDPKKGDSYKEMETVELINGLTEQYNDLIEICEDVERDTFSPDERFILINEAIKQCVDIGNYAMMIATNLEDRIDEPN